jgi:hypothetical protein
VSPLGKIRRNKTVLLALQYHPGVPTEQRVQDIAALAATLLTEYHQGTPLHDVRQFIDDADVEDGTTFVVEVDAAGSSLSGLLATFGAVQLAVDAAWVAVQYDGIAFHPGGEALDYEFVRGLANGPELSLEIVELSAGTFKGKFKARFPGPVTRAAVTGVAWLSATALHIMFPPAVLPTVILGGVGPAMALASAIHDRRAKKQAEQEQAEKDRRAQEEQAEKDRRLDRMQCQLDRLEAAAAQAGQLGTVDNDAVREADLRSVGIEVQHPPKAA